MELDKRIKPNKMPLTCFHIDDAKQFIGKNCYFSLTIEQFENLDKCQKATLTDILDCPTPFVGMYDNRNFCFIMPCDWVEDPNDVETLKKTITELRQKVAEQEKIIERLNGIEVRKENTKDDCDGKKAYEKEVDDFIKGLEKWLNENLGE